MFDNRFGPINQIIGWIAGRDRAHAVDDQPEPGLPGDPHRPRSGSGRRSCSCCCSRRSPTSTSRSSKRRRSTAPATGAPSSRIVLPAIWPVMAIAILIRGLDLFRLFDIVWALTKGGPGTMTETISIFTYVKGFQQFETSYTAAVALLDHRAAVGRRVLRAEARGVGAMMTSGDTPPRIRDRACALLARSLHHAALPVPDLLAVHDLVQDAGGDLRLSAEVVSRPDPVRQLRGAVQGRRRDHGMEQPGDRRREHGASPCSSARICAYSLARFKTGGEHLANWIISQRMVPPIAVVFPIFLLYVWLGWVDTYHRRDPALHRVQPALRDLDDARLHPRHPARARGEPRWWTAARAGRCSGRSCSRCAAPACSPPRSSPSCSPGTSSCSRWCSRAPRSRPTRCRSRTTSAASRISGPRSPPCRCSARCRSSSSSAFMQRYLVRGISLGAVKG